MRSKLYQFMVNIWNRVVGLKNIWQKVKQHPILKRTPNVKIPIVYNQVIEDKQLAKDFNKTKAATVIDTGWLKCGKMKGGMVKFSYHFYYEFPEGSRSGKSGRQAVHQSVDMPIGSTKSDITKAMSKQIRDWVDAHYSESGDGQGINRAAVDLIIAC